MELLDLPQLAQRADLPVSLARYYRDRFILFVPSVRARRTVLHPAEAVAVLKLIGDQAKSGATAAAIETVLEQAYPVTVITSQDVSSDGAHGGAAGVVNALAGVLDDRGARLEAEIVSLREAVTAATAEQNSRGLEERLSPAEALGNDTSVELSQIKQAIAALQAGQASLASHEQLEWIGDVVSAAVLRPTDSGSKEVIERKLAEIQEELRKPRPNADVAELRIAVERLSEYVHARDEEFQRVLKSLVAAMRAEVGSLLNGINELRRPVREAPPAMPLLLTSHRVEANGTESNGSHPDAVEASGDPHTPRSLRRLGQPNRPQDELIPKNGTAQNSE